MVEKLHMFYIPHYSDKTALKYGEIPKHVDVIARQRLIREMGFICIAEKWVKDSGFVPVWESDKDLTEDQMNLLCIRKLYVDKREKMK